MRVFRKFAFCVILSASAQSVEDGLASSGKQPRATWRELLQLMNNDEDDDTSPSILARGKKKVSTSGAGWGREPKNKFVEFKTCPKLATPKNARGVFCDGATCVVDCQAGFMPAGNPRINCVRNKAQNFVETGKNRWSGQLPDCQACEELPPIFDKNIDQFCFVNARDNQMTCEHQCTNGGKLTGMKGSVLRCACNQQGVCGWSRKPKKARFADTSNARCTQEFILPPQRILCEEKSILEFSTEAARITNSNDCKKCKLMTIETRFPASFDSDDTMLLELSQPLKSVGSFSFPIVSAELSEDETAILLTFYEFADMSNMDARMFLNIESKRKTPEVIGITTRPCNAKRSEFSVSPNSKGGGYGSTTSSVVSTTGKTTTSGAGNNGLYSGNSGSSYSGVYAEEVDTKKIENAVNEVTKEIGVKEILYTDLSYNPEPDETEVSDEEYETLVEKGILEPQENFKTFRRHYTDRTVCPEYDHPTDAACKLARRSIENDHDRKYKYSHATCIYNCDHKCPHTHCKEAQRRRRSTEVGKTIKRWMVTIQLLTKEKFNKTDFAEKTEDNIARRGIKILNLVPKEAETTKYFWTQQIFLIIAIISTCVFSVLNTRTLGKLSLLSTLFLSIVPLIDILPPVFVWYEYNTDSSLAVDPVEWVSGMLVFCAFVKLLNHVLKLTIVAFKTSKEDETMFIIMHKVLVEYRIIDQFLLKAVDFWLVYFYFSRFLVHGSPFILKAGCLKESLDLAEQQKEIHQTSADCPCAPFAQGIFTLVYRATQVSIFFSTFMIVLNDYVIDFCVEFAKGNGATENDSMEKWICSQVNNQSLSIMKGRITIENQCFQKKILESDFKSYKIEPHPFEEGCMVPSEFVIMVLTIWIVIASSALFVGVCMNLPPVTFSELKEKLFICNRKEKESEVVILAEQTTLMNPDEQKS
ncbi:Oidioi.mRNA.OKI2018_I69.XSR.g15670.t1.cds [Oikopleura dioica]|uniref:Oidioi.mRNA.OKI2018_I69.XSR.g15670.t1.cds n=1 Tax=Oikopleura dioica TaxID=34765 RepID=A0ABN7SKZ9_OIKDI|nr:Oidioi.mRNA.OKI2018_I69.XSR.g15670.t1.cds [Oikopleura dioica]